MPQERQTEQFRLWREDESGREYPMQFVGSRDVITEKQRLFERRGHKQFYFLKAEIIPDSHEAS